MAAVLLKDGLNDNAITRIAMALKACCSGDVDQHFAKHVFDDKAFHSTCMQGLEQLELKQRIHHIIAAMHQFLPTDFQHSGHILLQLKEHWHYGEPDDPYRGFAAWAVTDYVGVYGLQHPELSLQVLAYLTDLFSSEFSIRFLLLEHYEVSYQALLNWAEHDDEHIRRLASEGCRPRLPWGIRLQRFCQDPRPILAILEKLKDDSSEYVRRSVANNLNDISKDNPECVIRLCQVWHKDASDNTLWIIKHATRSLVKAGHPEVVALLGYTAKPQISLAQLTLQNKDVQMGNSLNFEVTLRSEAKKQQKLVIDYAVHHVKANGSRTAKVFKLKNINIAAGQTMQLNKKHAFKAISTRRYHAGTHSIEILINGIAYHRADFELLL